MIKKKAYGVVLRAIHRKVFFKRTNHMTGQNMEEREREGEGREERKEKEKGEKEQGGEKEERKKTMGI